jgi:hypothetical protein
MVSGLAWHTLAQKASTVWPDRLRPDRSVRVIEIISGKLAPQRLLGLQRRHDRRLGVQRVEHGLDEDEIDAALDQRIDLLAIDAFIVSKSTSR